jgi:type II secretory pathway pseudopilin PulG
MVTKDPSVAARSTDAGMTIIELAMGMVIAMIALGLVATVLVSANRQQSIASETADTVDHARFALSLLANEVREARTVTQDGLDAAAWFDLDHDGLQDDGEVEVYGVRPDGALSQLVREIDGASQTLVSDISSGALTVSLERTGVQLAIEVTLPPDDAGRGGITLRTEVVTRGNG